MAINSQEAKKMIEAAERTGKKLTIGYQNRYRDDAQFAHKVCSAGELGDIYYGKPMLFDVEQFLPGRIYGQRKARWRTTY